MQYKDLQPSDQRTQLRSLPSPVMFLGPAFCGKSELAEAALTPNLATAVLGTADVSEGELAQLVEFHKERRPQSWKTVEDFEDLVVCLSDVLSENNQIIVDSVNQWIAGLFVRLGPKYGLEEVQKIAISEASSLAEFMKKNPSVRYVLVSSEVASGLPPQSQSGRFFRQTLGKVNQILAAGCQSVVLVTAGIPQIIKREE